MSASSEPHSTESWDPLCGTEKITEREENNFEVPTVVDGALLDGNVELTVLCPCPTNVEGAGSSPT